MDMNAMATAEMATRCGTFLFCIDSKVLSSRRTARLSLATFGFAFFRRQSIATLRCPLPGISAFASAQADAINGAAEESSH